MRDLTLVLEASTGTGSLALLRGDVLVAEADVAMRGHDGERLMPAVVQLLEESGAAPTALARVVCGAGPGGFTSLRIAAAIAKGLVESLGVELWGASSLALLAAGDAGLGARREREGATSTEATGAPRGDQTSSGATGDAGRAATRAAAPVIAVLDALRGEWYCQQFARSPEGTIVADGAPGLLGQSALTALAAASGARVVGVRGETFPGGRDAIPRARDIVRLDPGALLAPVALEAWEPDYGRLAEAQVKWEQAHGRALGATG